MITFEQILYIIPVLALTASIFYYAMVIRNQNKTQKLQLETRQAALFTQIYNKFEEVEFAKNHSEIMKWKYKDYNEWVEKYGAESNPEANAKWLSVARFFHGVGVLVDKGLVDIQLVYDLMGDPVIQAWEKMGVITVGAREEMSSPDHGLAFENLYKKLIELKVK